MAPTSRSEPDNQLPRALAAGLGLAGWCAVVAFALAPLVINPLAYDDSYFSPKWMWIGTWALVGAAAVLGRACLGRAAMVPLSPAAIAAFAFWVLHLASVAWAESRSLALERALHVGSLTLALFVSLQFIRTRRALFALAWVWIGVAFATALWTLYQDAMAAWAPERLGLRPNLPDWRGYLAAGLGNTNHIGDFLAVTLPPTLVMLGEARRRVAVVALVVAAVALAAALTVSYSVGSNLGLALGGILMLGVTLRREGFRFFTRRPRRWLALAALWGAMLGFFILDHPLNPHRPGILAQGFGSGRWHEGGPTRLAIWAGGLEIVRHHPWLGVGAGNFTYAYPEMKSALLEGRPDLLKWQGLWTNAAHNDLLQAWSELGVAGAFCFLAIPILAFWSLLREIRWASRSDYLLRLGLAGALAAWLGHAMMNFSLEQPTGALSLYFILLGVAVEASTRKLKMRLPALALDKGWARIRVDFRTMGEPMAAGLQFNIQAKAASTLAFGLLGLALAAAFVLHRPLAAQAHYRLAREAASPPEIEHQVRQALALDPWATGCRSFYSDWLVKQGRPNEALAQLEVVRRRLNSPELWERQARALDLLGRAQEAAAARRVYADRVWLARHPEGRL